MRRGIALALLCATAAPAAAQPGGTVPVRIHIAFDRSIAPVTRVSAKREAQAIWRDNGVNVQWIDDGVQPDLCLDVTVERLHRPADTDAPQVVLGRAQLEADGTEASGAIHISFDAVESLLEALFGSRYDEELLRNVRIGTALGRVVAHEVGHVLLGPPVYHDVRGLMRMKFPTRELAAPDSSPYRLTDQSFVRLRTRLQSLAAEGTLAACAAGPAVTTARRETPQR